MARSEAQLNNLRKFKKGKSGNPKGRPLGALSMSTEFKKVLLEAMETKDKSKMEIAEALARNIVKRAFTNDNMAKLVVNYTDGMPRVKAEIKEIQVEKSPFTEDQIYRLSKRVVTRYEYEHPNKIEKAHIMLSEDGSFIE